MLAKLGITPVLFAAASTSYAASLVARIIAAAADAVVLKTFLGPTQLAEVVLVTLCAAVDCAMM